MHTAAMRTTPAATGPRPATGRRVVARVVCALLLVAGTAMISAPQADARPRNCGAMLNTADLYWGYANAEFAVGDIQEGNRWLNAYNTLVRRINDAGC
jgi:hypothetical protein